MVLDRVCAVVFGVAVGFSPAEAEATAAVRECPPVMECPPVSLACSAALRSAMEGDCKGDGDGLTGEDADGLPSALGAPFSGMGARGVRAGAEAEAAERVAFELLNFSCKAAAREPTPAGAVSPCPLWLWLAAPLLRGESGAGASPPACVAARTVRSSTLSLVFSSTATSVDLTLPCSCWISPLSSCFILLMRSSSSVLRVLAASKSLRERLHVSSSFAFFCRSFWPARGREEHEKGRARGRGEQEERKGSTKEITVISTTDEEKR